MKFKCPIHGIMDEEYTMITNVEGKIEHWCPECLVRALRRFFVPIEKVEESDV